MTHATGKKAPETAQESFRRSWHNLPNTIASVRLVASLCIPWILLAHPVETHAVWWWAAFALFIVLAASDKVDGMIARKRNLTSAWGKILDPLADKVLVYLTLFSICLAYSQPWLWIASILMAVREIDVTLRLEKIVGASGDVQSARQSGRIKMVAQSLMVPALLVPNPTPLFEHLTAGLVLLTVAVCLWSWVDYVKHA